MKAINNAYLLAVDQGTTGSRAFLFDNHGRAASSAYRELPQYYPQPGWVEHDAGQVWSCVKAVVLQALKGKDPSKIKAIGITNQRETTLIWERKTGKPLHRAIVWQDRRTSGACASTALKKHAAYIQRTTGLKLDPYFSATKIAWILRNVPEISRKVQKGEACFGTIDSWLLFNLTGKKVHVTDMTNASRTMLFDIRRKCWDKKLLKIFGIPSSLLPAVLPSAADYGVTDGSCGLPAGIPIRAVMGDQQAALYGQGCFKAGSMKNTYGTGCFLMMNTGKELRHHQGGLISTLACDVLGRPVFALEGSVFIAGAAVQWLRDGLKVIKESSETQAAIARTHDNNGVYFVPAFVGLGAPYWQPDARGIICGLTRGSSANHIIRAAVEAMAYQTKDIVDVMRQAYGKPVRALRVDGGACANDFLMQMQADLLRCRIERPAQPDSTAWGAAQLAGVSCGLWTPKDLAAMRSIDRIFVPKLSQSQAARLYQGWRQAVRRALI